jgi:polysaccharide transporter, PST family
MRLFIVKEAKGGHGMDKSMLLKGTIILSIAGLITKVISALYRVPFQNMAGDIGFYVYQQIYPFYGIAIILATIGFPAVISKIVIEQQEREKGELQQAIFTSFLFLQVAGVLLFLTLYFGAPFIAKLMSDPKLLMPIRSISFIFLFVPTVSVIRGYFQGAGNMLPTAISQVIEQLLRVTFILVITFYFIKWDYNIYMIGAGAAFASVVGLFFSGMLLYLLVKKYIPRKKFKIKWLNLKKYFYLIPKLFKQGIIISLSVMTLILFQLVDAFTLVPLLHNNGLNLYEAKVMKGILDRGQPLIQLGTVIATSIALPLIPLLALSKRNNSLKTVQMKAEQAIRSSLVFGMAASIGLAIIIEPTNMMLFKNAKGTDALFILSFTIMFSSISIVSAAILQGINKDGVTARHVFVGVLVKLTLSLMFVPYFQIKGAALATVIGFMIISILNLHTIFKLLGKGSLPNKKTIFSTAFAMLFLILIAFSWKITVNLIINGGMPVRLQAVFTALSTAIIGVISFIFMMIKAKVYKEDELKAVPLLKRFSFMAKLN